MRHLDQGRLAADDTDRPRGKGPGALPRRGVSEPSLLGGAARLLSDSTACYSLYFGRGTLALKSSGSQYGGAGVGWG